MESRLIGKVVSRRFRIEQVIGRGGMAIVYRAYDQRTHQTVAFKVLREEFEADDEYLKRFNREAEACRKLNHPNIVNLIDAGAVGGVHYIAMEYVDGKTLKGIIQEQGRLPPDDAVHYTLQILAALSHAHSHRIIHRDVKPQNIMVTRSGQLKVTDFGIAGIADTKTLTSDGSVIGSVHYFSPEQAKGMRATAASDLYSVGVILYEMLTGHVPFDGETAVSVAMMHLMKTPSPVESEVDVSPALARIVEKSLQKNPQERYQSADAMAKDLRRGLRHPDGRFMDNERRVKRPQPHHAKEKRSVLQLIVPMTAALLVFITAFAGFTLYRMLFVYSQVPDLTGLSQAAAEKLVVGAGLEAELAWEYSDMAEGAVIGQVPAAGEQAERGSVVIIRLSQGSGLVTIPAVTGLSEEEAGLQLAASGLSVGEIKDEVSELLKGLVVSQDPAAGEKVTAGAMVDLTVSVGRVVVPELTGLREEEAIQRIEEVGLSIGEITSQEVKSSSQDGYVLAQSLPQFMDAAPEEVISLTVGRYMRRNKTYNISFEVQVPEGGCTIRVTLLEDEVENEMYAAHHEGEGTLSLTVQLRSETAGLKKWRLYVDGNLREEHEVTIL